MTHNQRWWVEVDLEKIDTGMGRLGFLAHLILSKRFLRF